MQMSSGGPARGPSILGALARGHSALVRRIAGESADPDTLIRAHAFVWYAAVLLLLAVGWGSTLYQYGAGGSGTFFTSAALAILVVVKAAWDQRLRFACHTLVGAALVLTSSANFLTGGLRMTNVCAFFMVVVASVFLLGRTGLIWSLTALLVALVFEAGHWSEFQFPDVVPLEARPLDAFMTWFFAALVVLSFVVAYEVARERTVRMLRLANRAKIRFLANVSHELRTPIHAIMGMNNELAERDLDRAQQRTAIAASQQNAQTLLAFMDDLLDLASAEQGKFSVRDSDFDPVAVVESTTHVVRVLADAQDLDIQIDVAADVPRWVRGDPRRLRQVLTNIGANAAKFTDSGYVRLSVAPLEGSEHGCVFAVHDTGSGIAVKDQRRIFESFAQVGSPLTQDRGGAGLGLSIARELIELMGGAIDVESTVGKGSSFIVELPFEAPESDGARDQSSEPVVPRLKVLLVEDLELNRDLAEAMLRSSDHEVIVACNGLQAVDRWQAEEPDVILMDIKMPGMDGLTATRSIRERERTDDRKPVHIVAMTGQATEQERIACLDAGMDDCLFKPFSAHDLSTVLRQVGATSP